jgi:hypothetical protein
MSTTDYWYYVLVISGESVAVNVALMDVMDSERAKELRCPAVSDFDYIH